MIQNCCSDHLRWRAARAADYLIYLTIWCIQKQRQMSRLESSHLTVFSRSSHLTVFTKSVQNTLTVLTATYSIEFTVAFSKSRYFYSHMKFHNLLGISGKMCIKAKFQKTEFDKYATSWERGCSITSIYFIHFIMDQNCHDSC